MKIVAALLATGLLLTACERTPAEAPPSHYLSPVDTIPPSPIADPVLVHWMDGFCTAVHGYRNRAQREADPTRPTPGSVAEAQRELSADLGAMAARTGEVVAELDALPAAPVPVAETARRAFAAKFSKAHDRATAAKARLDRAKPGDQASQAPAAEALEQAQQDIEGTYDPVGAVTSSPELMLAAENAPGCKA
ncbi:hypothetical protein AB0J55_35720 [Amycolatopsis sp. NPDC049688]|uniref:hypothetical protein n=1 Tax=Amycolatopsis sp. NPDC049688 TaxID=3154733 RepID=UPI003449B68A